MSTDMPVLAPCLLATRRRAWLAYPLSMASEPALTRTRAARAWGGLPTNMLASWPPSRPCLPSMATLTRRVKSGPNPCCAACRASRPGHHAAAAAHTGHHAGRTAPGARADGRLRRADRSALRAARLWTPARRRRRAATITAITFAAAATLAASRIRRRGAQFGHQLGRRRRSAAIIWRPRARAHTHTRPYGAHTRPHVAHARPARTQPGRVAVSAAAAATRLR